MTDQTPAPVQGHPSPPRRGGGLRAVVASVAAVVVITVGGLVAWKVLFASGPRPGDERRNGQSRAGVKWATAGTQER